jgi:alcohol dehydrogenase class IV
MLLPTVMAFSISGHPSRYAQVAKALGSGLDDPTAATEASVQIVRDLADELEVPTLREWGVNEQAFREVMSTMAHDAIDSGSPANNPRSASHKEIVALYEEVIST